MEDGRGGRYGRKGRRWGRKIEAGAKTERMGNA